MSVEIVNRSYTLIKLSKSWRKSQTKTVNFWLSPNHSRPENMIIKNLAVAPPPVRPSVMMSSTNRSEDDLTYAY